MKLESLITSILIISLFICCEKSTEPFSENIEQGDEIIPLPDSIIKKANLFLISWVGQEFFDAYVSYDSTRSEFRKADSFCVLYPVLCAEYLLDPNYRMVYRLKMPHLDFVDEYIDFILDSVGNLIEEREPSGIPQCPDNNCWNYFPAIDEKQAFNIARNAGFEAGIREWYSSFYFYNGDIKDYVWNIKNTTFEQYDGSKLESIGGRSIIIHAGTGEVIKISGWGWIY